MRVAFWVWAGLAAWSGRPAHADRPDKLIAELEREVSLCKADDVRHCAPAARLAKIFSKELAHAMADRGCAAGNQESCAVRSELPPTAAELRVQLDRARALCQSEAEGCLRVAALYQQGAAEILKDATEEEWFDKACRVDPTGEGCLDAAKQYVQTFGRRMDGPLVIKWIVSAMAPLNAACDRDDQAACYRLGAALDFPLVAADHTQFRPDQPRAMALWRKACKSGHARSCQKTILHTTNQAEGLSLLIQECARDSVVTGWTCEQLGLRRVLGKLETPVDISAGLGNLERACAVGEPDACLTAADIHGGKYDRRHDRKKQQRLLDRMCSLVGPMSERCAAAKTRH